MKPTNKDVRLLLQFEGDHIPSFKNAKRAILDRNTGMMRTLTEGSVKKRMERIIQSFVSQLFSDKAILAPEIPQGSLKQSLTLSLLPEDDSNKWLAELNVKTERVPKGEEGVAVLIEQI